jgi:hypothetical protein
MFVSFWCFIFILFFYVFVYVGGHVYRSVFFFCVNMYFFPRQSTFTYWLNYCRTRGHTYIGHNANDNPGGLLPLYNAIRSDTFTRRIALKTGGVSRILKTFGRRRRTTFTARDSLSLFSGEKSKHFICSRTRRLNKIKTYQLICARVCVCVYV